MHICFILDCVVSSGSWFVLFVFACCSLLLLCFLSDFVLAVAFAVACAFAFVVALCFLPWS